MIKYKGKFKMSDVDENVHQMPVLQKRPLLSISLHTDGSGDEQDDISSTASTIMEDVSSVRSDTPTQTASTTRRFGRGKYKNKRCKLQYKCNYFAKEDHGQPIFGITINHYTREGDPVIFATVGHNRVTIYEIEEESKLKLLQAYVDPSPEENYYCCAWTFDDVTGQPLLAASGCRGIIRIINPITLQCIKHFIGHGNAVNELKFHPKEPNMLLSASKDHTMRIWNIKTNLCVVIFGGVDGHRDEVLSADFNIDGSMIVSCGMDHSLKIWKTDTEAIQDAVKHSYTFNADKSTRPFPTACEYFPYFSTRDIHRNYVDCVRWFGTFLLSKSCENCIICWKPGGVSDTSFKANETSVTMLHKFDYRDCDIWYMRFGIDYYQKVIALGNQVGKVFVWDIDVEDPSQAKCTVLSHQKCNTPIRQIAFTKDSNVLLAVSDDGTVWRWDRIK